MAVGGGLSEEPHPLRKNLLSNDEGNETEAAFLSIWTTRKLFPSPGYKKEEEVRIIRMKGIR